MRKLTIVLFVILGVTGGKDVFARGSDFTNTNIFGLGLSLSYSYDYTARRTITVPPMIVYYETGVHEYITVGPFAAFSSWDYRDRQRSFLTIGGRGSFHLTPFINDWFDAAIDEHDWDIYVAMASGFDLRSYGAYADEDARGFRQNVRFFLGPFAGVRYYLSGNVAIYSEIGLGPMGALSGGVSWEL